MAKATKKAASAAVTNTALPSEAGTVQPVQTDTGAALPGSSAVIPGAQQETILPPPDTNPGDGRKPYRALTALTDGSKKGIAPGGLVLLADEDAASLLACRAIEQAEPAGA